MFAIFLCLVVIMVGPQPLSTLGLALSPALDSFLDQVYHQYRVHHIKRLLDQVQSSQKEAEKARFSAEHANLSKTVNSFAVVSSC